MSDKRTKPELIEETDRLRAVVIAQARCLREASKEADKQADALREAKSEHRDCWDKQCERSAQLEALKELIIRGIRGEEFGP